MDEKRFREMMTLATAGDEAAADCLFVACYEPLQGVVLGFMDHILRRAYLEPEDILQEAYAAAWPNLQRAEFENFPAFVAWMKTIIRNKVIDLRRGLLAEKHDVHRQVAQPVIGTSYLNLLDQVASPVATPSRGAARREALAMLSGQMWRLPEDYRHVIRWRFIQGLPVAEVAKMLDRTEPAVHMLCHRALIKLRQFMGSPSKYLTSM